MVNVYLFYQQGNPASQILAKMEEPVFQRTMLTHVHVPAALRETIVKVSQTELNTYSKVNYKYVINLLRMFWWVVRVIQSFINRCFEHFFEK